MFTIVVTLMMLQSYSTIPQYRATARLLIDDERVVMVAGMDSNNPIFWADPEPYYETQYRILQSPGLAQYTIRQLDLSTAPKFTGEAPSQFGDRSRRFARPAQRSLSGPERSAHACSG